MEQAQNVRGRSFLARIRNYFLTGLIVTAPVGITVALALAVINWIDGKIVPLIPQGYNPQLIFQDYVGIHVPGIGLVVVLIGLKVREVNRIKVIVVQEKTKKKIGKKQEKNCLIPDTQNRLENVLFIMLNYWKLRVRNRGNQIRSIK